MQPIKIIHYCSALGAGELGRISADFPSRCAGDTCTIVKRYGPETVTNGIRNYDEVLYNLKNHAHIVKQTIQQGFKPICIGGSHEMAAGTIAGVLSAINRHEDVRGIWFDAHYDMNQPGLPNFPAPSSTNNFHGMPLAHACGLFHLPITPQQYTIEPQKWYFICGRDGDPAEELLIDHLKFNQHNNISKIPEIIEMGPCIINIDVDGLDAKHVPYTGTEVGTNSRRKNYNTGPDLEPFLKVIKGIAHHTNVLNIDIAEGVYDLDAKKDHAGHPPRRSLTTYNTTTKIINAVLQRKDQCS